MSRQKNILEKNENLGSLSVTTSSGVVDATGLRTLSVQAIITAASTPTMDIKFQKSNDGGTTWSDEGSATNITANGTIWLEKVDPTGGKYKVLVTRSAGSAAVNLYWVGKGIDG
jgi:hypothetical protein